MATVWHHNYVETGQPIYLFANDILFMPRNTCLARPAHGRGAELMFRSDFSSCAGLCAGLCGVAVWL